MRFSIGMVNMGNQYADDPQMQQKIRAYKVVIYLFIKYHIFWYMLSINVNFIESSLYNTKFYSIYRQKNLWMYTIVVFNKKQKQGGNNTVRDVLREEKKFLLNQAEALKLRNYLSNVVHTDSHNGPDGYQVRSLYFDSLSNRDFQEKEDGLELRRKFRLRVYSPDADFALFEMKQKQGPYQRKRSLRLSRREAQALIEGDYSVLLNSGSEFGQECYSIMEMWAYRPKTVVEYDRFAFIAPENSIRITFDSGIRANEINFNLFDRNLVLNSVMSPFAVVLEVKYNGFLLSYIKHMLLPVQKSELSVSKYCMARQIGCDYRF